MALDDPGGWEIYHQIQDAAKNDPAIHLFTNLTGVGNIEINAFQRLSDVVIQKSIREGFGLAVSEALWKETPVVAGRAGGIPLQMRAGGFLIDSVEECARMTLRLLKNPEEGQQLARNGQELVRERFLLTRLIGDEHLGSLPHGAQARPGGVGNIDPQTVTSYQPRCRDRQLLPSTGSPAAIHAFLPSPYSHTFA
jgi:trehalose synthase